VRQVTGVGRVGGGRNSGKSGADPACGSPRPTCTFYNDKLSNS